MCLGQSAASAVPSTEFVLSWPRLNAKHDIDIDRGIWPCDGARWCLACLGRLGRACRCWLRTVRLWLGFDRVCIRQEKAAKLGDLAGAVYLDCRSRAEAVSAGRVDLHQQALDLVRAGQSWDDLYRNVHLGDAVSKWTAFDITEMRSPAETESLTVHTARNDRAMLGSELMLTTETAQPGDLGCHGEDRVLS